MESKFLVKILLIIILVGHCGCVGAGGNVGALRVLIGLSKNEKQKLQSVKKETENFNKVKYFIINKEIKKGITSRYAARKFGKPIVIFSELEGEKWIYKASDAEWIGGEKIYLFFDRAGALVNWECIDCS